MFFQPPEQGGNARSLDFAKILVERGHQVILFTSQNNFPDFSDKTVLQLYDGVEVYVLPVKYQHMMPIWRRIWAFLLYGYFLIKTIRRLPKPDLILASSVPPMTLLVALWFKKYRSIPFVYECLDPWPAVPLQMLGLEKTVFAKILYLLEKIWVEACFHIICLSEGSQNYFVQKYGIEVQKISVIPNGTQTQKMTPVSTEEKLRIRKELKLPEDAFIWVYAGTMGRANALETWIEPFFELQKTNNKKIAWVIIGTGNRADAFQNKLKEYIQLYSSKSKEVPHLSYVSQENTSQILDANLSANKHPKHYLSLGDSIYWISTFIPAEEVKSYLQASDLGIVSFAPYPILECNSANKFYDYLSCGLPVAINYGGWQKQWIEKEEIGFVWQNSTEPILGLNDYIQDAHSQPIMQKRTRHIAETHFSRNMLGIQFSEILEEKIKIL